jgi:hypothetical protein
MGNRNKQNEQTYGPLQEHGKFKTFTDSLLSRASKISDLINQLESVFSETGKPDDGPDASRLKKPKTQFQSYTSNTMEHFVGISYPVDLAPSLCHVQSWVPCQGQVACLEDSIAVLEKHFELCQTVKVETSELGREGLDDDTKSQPLDSKRNQLCPRKFQIETSNPLHLSSVHDNLRRLRKIDAQIRSTTMKCLRKSKLLILIHFDHYLNF